MVTAALFILFALLGEDAPSDPPSRVVGEGDVFVQVAASHEWLTPSELISRAREHAESKGVSRRLIEQRPRVWIYTEPQQVLAEVRFGGGIGQESLTVRFGRDGNALDHVVSVGLDRVTVSPRVIEEQLRQLAKHEARIREQLQAARDANDREMAATLERLLQLTQELQEIERKRYATSQPELPDEQP